MEKDTIQTKRPTLLGMIFSPGEQFERVKERPVIWLPLIILTVLTTLVALYVTVNLDFTAISGMEMTPEQEQMVKVSGVVSAILGGLVGTPISYLIFAAIFLGISKLAKSEVSFKQMFSLIIHVSFISLIGQVLNQVIIVAIGANPSIMITSLQSIIAAEGALGRILSVIEVFSIWYYILMALGLMKVANLSKLQACIIVGIFFIIGLIIAAVTPPIAPIDGGGQF
ncbi:Yip1 family protein [Bacillus weihaiensis]|uniref:Yip1 family protein n=1 Tax=Bacillus weihaiensis TaxID=1547283 RepID=UPI0023555645|nr:Yip1 family protein [Bacillus weihaiensis]